MIFMVLITKELLLPKQMIFFQSKLFSPLSQPLSPLVLSPLVPIVSQLINADGNFYLVFSFVLPNIRVAKCHGHAQLL